MILSFFGVFFPFSKNLTYTKTDVDKVKKPKVMRDRESKNKSQKETRNK